MNLDPQVFNPADVFVYVFVPESKRGDDLGKHAPGDLLGLIDFHRETGQGQEECTGQA